MKPTAGSSTQTHTQDLVSCQTGRGLCVCARVFVNEEGGFILNFISVALTCLSRTTTTTQTHTQTHTTHRAANDCLNQPSAR